MSERSVSRFCPRCAPKSRDLDEYETGLVVFDTNVVESRYLAPLLRGEVCRDFERLRAHTPALQPAIYVKSFYEICQHAKRGEKGFPWMAPELGYPGGIERGRRIMQEVPDCDPEVNLWWWLCMSEEWMACDWDREEERVRVFVRSEDQENAILTVRAREVFSEWKRELSGFCTRIWSVLNAQTRILTAYDVYGPAGEFHDEVFALEQDLAVRRFLPNEDFEIVAAALACRARAFVTTDAALLSRTSLSIGLNWKTAFVHPDRLADALDDGLLFRWSREQTSPRRSGPIAT